MLEIKVDRVSGLRELSDLFLDKIPAQARRRVLLGAMKEAAGPMLETARAASYDGDGSGSLAEALALVSASKGETSRARRAALVHLTPRRKWRPAVAKYIQHYYTLAGRPVPLQRLRQGLYHGHWVEFGSVHQSPRPFLRRALTNAPTYYGRFARIWRKRIEREVARQRRKTINKRRRR